MRTRPTKQDALVGRSFLLAGATLVVTEWARTQPFGLLHWVVMPTALTIVASVLLFDMWQY